jgi:hypothetical protein
VKRVLVMLEYEDGDPDNGEVFDLTDLAKELRLKDEKYHHAQITMKVEASCDYSRRDEVGYEPKTEICWNVMQAFDSSGDSGWLDDAVNASLPTSETTRGLIKRVSKAEKNLEKLRDAVKEQRLAEAAEVRGKYPICRIMPNATGLAEVSAKEG